MRPKTTFLFLIPIFATLCYKFKFNNTCKTYSGYFNIFFSSDCYYNPDIDSNIVEIIQRHVGVSESHQVQTEDGYILTLFRIPRETPKGVMLLQHSILMDAQIWVSQFNNSIAFLFWRAGYDVWLGNSRGTFHSKRHATLNPKEKAFWNFTFHEMGYYDHHATINYIVEKTNQAQIIYLGLSMAASSGLVYASTRPEEAAKSIKLMVSMAPVTHVYRSTSVAKYFVPQFFFLQKILNFADLETTIFSKESLQMNVVKFLLKSFSCKKCVVYFMASLTGWTVDETDPELVNMLINTFGAETPLKVPCHFCQIFNAGGKFLMYDYGEEGNLIKYGNKTPPLYPLENIKIPVFLVYAQNDTLTCKEDNEVLYSLLPEKSRIYGNLMVEGFSHFDFIGGRHRNERFYEKILQLLEEV